MAEVIGLSVEPIANDGTLRARVVAKHQGRIIHIDTLRLDSAVSRTLPVTESPTTSEPTMTAVATATPSATTAPLFQ